MNYDCDGTCAFLILRKYKEFGYPVPVKGKPELNVDFLNKVTEYSPDLIFVLDKPKISQDFVNKVSVPIVWIDHHPLQSTKGIKIYCNPLIYDIKDTRSTTYWAYQIIKDFKWVAMVGCIADYHIPNFAAEFSKEYPDLFSTEINDPYEILNATSKEGMFLLERYEKGNLIYMDLYNKAMKDNNDKDFLIFTYPDNGFAISSELATELQYRNKEKYVIVGRVKEDSVVLSIRCNKRPVRDILLKALEGLNGYGGGHLHACGAGIPKDNFVMFVKRFKDLADKEIRI